MGDNDTWAINTDESAYFRIANPTLKLPVDAPRNIYLNGHAILTVDEKNKHTIVWIQGFMNNKHIMEIREKY